MRSAGLGWSLVLLAGLCGCRKSAEGRDASVRGPSPKRLVLGTTQPPDTLDPVKSESAGAREVLELLYRGLGAYDEDWRFVPGLAEGPPEVETSSAGPVLSFRLRPGLTWSDGRALEAQDFVHGHAVLTDPERSPRTLSAYQVLRKVEAVAPDRLRVHLRAGADVEHVFSLLFALPRHAAPSTGATAGTVERAPITNGPYELHLWRPGESIELVKRPGWRGAEPGLDRIVFRFFESEDAFEAALLTGRIDALGEASGLSVGKARQLAARLQGSHVVERAESGVWLQVSIRHDHPLTRDLAVRRAMNLALDRDALVTVVYEGEASAVGGLFPPRHPVGARPPPARDLEAARAGLEAAGFRRRGELYEKDGAKLELEMLFATGSEASERAASFIAASLAEVPIRVRLRGVPLRVLFELQLDPARPPLAMMAWRLPPDWDAASVVGEGGSKNYGAFRDPEIQRGLEAARTASSPERWREHLAAVDQRAAETLPVLSLAFRRSVSVRPAGLRGWRPTGTITPVTWNAEQWQWDRESQVSAGRRLDGPGGAE